MRKTRQDIHKPKRITTTKIKFSRAFLRLTTYYIICGVKKKKCQRQGSNLRGSLHANLSRTP